MERPCLKQNNSTGYTALLHMQDRSLDVQAGSQMEGLGFCFREAGPQHDHEVARRQETQPRSLASSHTTMTATGSGCCHAWGKQSIDSLPTLATGDVKKLCATRSDYHFHGRRVTPLKNEPSPSWVYDQDPFTLCLTQGLHAILS